MKTQLISIMPSGYGHKKITIEYTDGKKYSSVTSNMGMVDAYNTEVFTRKQERKKAAALRQIIRFVKDTNGLR